MPAKTRGGTLMGFSLNYALNKVWCGAFSHFDPAIATHAVSTRLGGKSEIPYLSLNLGLHTGDDVSVVRENRRLFCQAVGLDFNKVVTAEQIHGANVVAVGTQHAGKGVTEYATAIKGTDALITNEPNLALMLFFADCVPVLILDPIRKAIGLSHAGWKGTVAKIAQKTVLAMQSEFGTKPEECLVGIAPSIGPCCYEVDSRVANQFKDEFVNWENILQPYQSKWKLNLWLANQVQLLEIGVKSENIIISEVCTACNQELFFSYRSEQGITGRIAAAICLNS